MSRNSKMRLSLWQSIECSLGYGASALAGGFGFLQYFANHNQCCVHDRIAETIVIRDRGRMGGSLGLKIM